MKRFVNGAEVELSDGSEVEIKHLAGRLFVRTAHGTHSAAAVRSGDAVLVSYRGTQYRVEKSQSRKGTARAGDSGEILAPMPGLIVDVLVAPGQEVALGQKLLVLEAMKTQQAFVAPFAGRVAALEVETGAQVAEGQRLAAIEPKPPAP